MNGEAIEEQLQKLREDLARLHGDLAQFASVVSETGKGEDAAPREARDRLRDAAQKMADVTRMGQQGIESVTKQVTEHPLMSLAAAFGLGYAVGKLFGRS